jgi:peptidoglycan/xylan/chitin deacetylase (PgdA/CDA1 family)
VATAGTSCQPVSLSFDDGPDQTTPSVLSALQANGLTATFFVIGKNAATDYGQSEIQAENAAGMSVQDHTWDHPSFTGQSTGTAHLTQDQITSELQQTAATIQAAGLPAPTLYRPPYGDDDAWSDTIARNLGLRVALSYSQASSPEANTIVDSKDWTGISASQTAANVENGISAASAKGIVNPLIAMHDTIPANVQAIPQIAQWMQANGYCSTTAVRQDATGGVVPVPAQPEPTSGNLVVNPSMETMWAPGNAGGFPQNVPYCWDRAGYGQPGVNASFTPTSDAHTGNVAENITVSGWQTGDSKLVIVQRGKGTGTSNSCTPDSVAVTGATYTVWEYYKGSWPGYGASTDTTKVSFALYYRNSSNQWVYWAGSPIAAPSSSWNLASFTTPPLPAGATAVSFGLAIQGNGTLSVDDAAMTHS